MNTIRTKGLRAGNQLNEKMTKVFLKMQPALNMATNAMASFVSKFDDGDIEVMAMLLSGVTHAFTGLATAVGVAGDVIMGVLKPIFAILKGIGSFIGQFAASVAMLDFSHFDMSGAFDIGGKFLGHFGGEELKASSPSAMAKSAMDVNVNVGLAKGLEETERATASTMPRRSDVGAMAGL